MSTFVPDPEVDIFCWNEKGARLGRLGIRRGEHQVSPGVASAPVAPGVHIASVGYEQLPEGVVSSTSLCMVRVTLSVVTATEPGPC